MRRAIPLAVLALAVAAPPASAGWHDWTDTPTLGQRILPGCKPGHEGCRHLSSNDDSHERHERATPMLPHETEHDRCRRLHVAYWLRHPDGPPQALKATHGCRRWLLDQRFHSRMPHADLTPSVESAIMDTIVNPAIPEGKL